MTSEDHDHWGVTGSSGLSCTGLGARLIYRNPIIIGSPLITSVGACAAAQKQRIGAHRTQHGEPNAPVGYKRHFSVSFIENLKKYNKIFAEITQVNCVEHSTGFSASITTNYRL